MIVRDVVDRPCAEGHELSARLSLDALPGRDSALFLRRPTPGGALAAPGDPLLASLLTAAMALHEDLVIEARVSRELLEAAETRVVPALLEWHPRMQRVAVQADLADEARPPGADATGSLFSSGIDSWYTLLRRRPSIRHLVHIRGFEMELDNEAAWERVHASVRATASRFGVEVLPVVTNFRAGIVDGTREALEALGRPWRKFPTEAWFGGFLVGIGRALHPPLGRLLIPASWTLAVTRPVASHPSMEPAWSTPAMGYEIDGLEAARPEKLAAIFEEEPEAVRDLCVCVDVTGRPRVGLNCGRCVKCVRLAFELRLAGIPPELNPLPAPLDLHRVKVRRIPYGDLDIWDQLLQRAEAIGDTDARDAILVLLDRKFYGPRFLRDVRRAVRRRSLAEIHWPRK